MRLIVGLGNPGAQYANTRHNAGFWLVTRLAQRFAISLHNEAKYKAHIGRGTIAGQPVYLMLPQTFMNLSGQSVVPFCKFYNIAPAELLIAHDELDIAVGTVRLKTGGGHGGHNGLRDIVPHLGADFHRLRIGIGRPAGSMSVSAHVLAKAPSSEQGLIDAALEEVSRHVETLVQGDVAKAMNALNGFVAK
jgi:PTH1 family peptidyl-tRNA hydrolase